MKELKRDWKRDADRKGIGIQKFFRKRIIHPPYITLGSLQAHSFHFRIRKVARTSNQNNGLGKIIPAFLNFQLLAANAQPISPDRTFVTEHSRTFFFLLDPVQTYTGLS